MRICLDARMLFHSGIGTYLKNLIRGIASLEKELILIIHPGFENQFELPPKAQLIYTKVEIYSLQEQIVLPFLIPHCEIFLSPHYNIPLFTIRARSHVCVIHDIYHIAHLQELNLLKKIYAKTMMRAAIFKAKQLVTVSQFSLSEITKFYPSSSDKIQHIPLAVDTEFFSTPVSQQEKENFFRDYQLHNPFFLFVGSLKPHKNLQFVLNAFEHFSKENTADLVVLGIKKESIDASVLGEFKRNNPTLANCVHCLNYLILKDLRTLYKSALSLLFVSLYEGFGFPPLEAMASGCPVIASKRASIPEVCMDAALYTDVDCPSSLSHHMSRVLNDGVFRDKWIKKGFLKAKEYSWNDTVNQHLQLFNRL